jgi:hypothetical protein
MRIQKYSMGGKKVEKAASELSKRRPRAHG